MAPASTSPYCAHCFSFTIATAALGREHGGWTGCFTQSERLLVSSADSFCKGGAVSLRSLGVEDSLGHRLERCSLEIRLSPPSFTSTPLNSLKVPSFHTAGRQPDVSGAIAALWCGDVNSSASHANGLCFSSCGLQGSGLSRTFNVQPPSDGNISTRVEGFALSLTSATAFGSAVHQTDWNGKVKLFPPLSSATD